MMEFETIKFLAESRAQSGGTSLITYFVPSFTNL